MEGGPYSQENKTGVNIDEVIAAGNAGVTPMGTDVTTKETPDISTGGGNFNRDQQQGGGRLNVTYEDPTYAWKPTQQDFGQVDPYSFNFDTGNVPVERFQHGFPAIANRQMGLQQRKEAAAQKQAALTQKAQGGGAQPHDRYKIAFNNYAKNTYAEKRRKLAEGVFKGDMAQTDRFLNKDPDGQRLLKEWGTELETIAAENKHWVDASIEALVKHEKGAYIPPDQLKAIQGFAQSVDSNGMAIQGLDTSEFIPKMRDVETSLRQIEFLDKVVKPAFDDSFSKTTGFNLESKRVGGKYVMTKSEVKSFEEMKDFYMENNEDYVDAIFNGNKAAARKMLDAAFPISVEESKQFISPFQPREPKTPSDDKGKTINNTVVLSEGKTPWLPASDEANVKPSGETFGVGPIGDESKVVNMLTKAGKNLGRTTFRDKLGQPAPIYPLYLQSDPIHPSQHYIVGESATGTETDTKTEGDDDSDVATKSVDSMRKKNIVRLPVEGNEDLLDVVLQGLDWRSSLNARGSSKESAPKPTGKKKTIAGF